MALFLRLRVVVVSLVAAVAVSLVLAGNAEAANVSGTAKYRAGDKTENCKGNQDGSSVSFVPAGTFGNAKSGKLEENGSFSITGLDNGDYHVTIAGCGDKSDKEKFWYGRSIKVVKVPGNIDTAKEGDWEWEEYRSDCADNAGHFAWLVCDGMKFLTQGIDWLLSEVISPLMRTEPLTSDGNKELFAVWEGIRNVANVAFVLIFMLTIFGTAIGFDNYTIKKMLPRIIAAAVFIQFSWWIAGFVIDVGNVLGLGLKTLIESSLPKDFGNTGLQLDNFGQKASTTALFTAGAIVATAGLIGISLATIISALIVLVVIFGILVLRKILIMMLVVLAPVAFVLWVLPNTERYFKEWWQMFFKLIMMFPLIVMLFVMGRIFSGVAGTISGAGSALVPVYQLAGYVIPLILIPWTFGTAGKLFSAGVGAINKAGKWGDSKIGKSSDLAKAVAENRQAKNAMRATNSSDIKMFGRNIKGSGALRRGIGGMRSGVGANLEGLVNRAAYQRKLETASDKASNDRAAAEALKVTREQLGRQSTDNIIATRSAIQAEKGREGRVAQAGMQPFSYIDSNGNEHKFTKMDDAIGHNDALKAKARQAAESGDYATMMRAMQVMGRTNGGADAIERELRPELFGGTDQRTVDTAKMNGNAAAFYKEGSSTIDATKNPDAIKTPDVAWSGMSDRDFANLSHRAQARYMEYMARNGKEAEAKTVITEALNNARLSFGSDELKAQVKVATDANSPYKAQYGGEFAAMLQARYAKAQGQAPANVQVNVTVPPGGGQVQVSPPHQVDPAVEEQTGNPHDPRSIS